MRRPTAAERGYDIRWDAAASSFRDAHPYCCGCQAIGVVRAAAVVDHIVPHEGDPVRFWARDNWQAACKWHHDSVKPMLERQWKAGKLSAQALRLDSPQAIALTKTRYRPAVGVDGFAIKNS